jgi:hypothetical protein
MMRWCLTLLTLGACVDSTKGVPGATQICDTRLGPLVNCGPNLGGAPIDRIRDACTKLADCGIIAVQAPDGRTFDKCVSDFEQYPIDTLPAILDCIANSSCEQQVDPKDGDHSICERFAKLP